MTATDSIEKSAPAKKMITFVFSDIEHSTRLAQMLRDRYPALLKRHRAVIRNAIHLYRGREIDTAGDGFFMTFDTPMSAILATVDVQRKFHTQPWATDVGLKVRMGIHTGVALPTDTGYTGVDVHYASRVCNAAYGGQVLISLATREFLYQETCDGFGLADLGKYVFRDFSEPVALFQLNIDGIRHPHLKPRVEPDDKRIAVLPFVNHSADPEYAYLGEGMAEEIIMALSKVQGLRVVSRSSSFALQNEGLSPMQVGQKLNVNSVLEGRVRAQNGDTRISVELVDAESGLNIWTGQYNSAQEHLLKMQKEITREIVEALECNLIPEQIDSIQERQTDNAEAYDYYLRGRRFYLQFSTRGINLALRMFENAIAADNQYSLAYAGIADCYSFQYQHSAAREDLLDKAAQASKEAIDLAPELADAHVSRGIVMSLRGEYAEAEKAFEHAIEKDPTLFLGWFHYARMCFATGKLEKAARLFEHANRVEPEDYQSILLAAQVCDDINCGDLTAPMRRRGVENAEKRLELNPGDTRALYLAANALVFLGEKEKSLAFLQRALMLEPDDSMMLYNAACVYALLEMKSEALRCLEASYAAGLTLRGWYENDNNLDSIREEPRFKALMARMKD